MKQIYDFEQHTPPRLNEDMLREKMKLRTMRRQTMLLRIASLLCCICYAVFAFVILHDSVAASVISIIMLTVTLIGNGLISLVFLRHGMTDQQ